jgi:hypothetical protein
VVNIDLRGTVSNRYGIGATVRVESALGTQVRQLTLARGYMSSSEPMLHFGLGADTTIRRMVVTWPSGHVQAFENVAVDQRYTITEPAGAIPIPPDAPREPGQFAEVSRGTGLSLASREEDVDEINVQRLLPIRQNPRGPALAVGDVFGNGRDDPRFPADPPCGPVGPVPRRRLERRPDRRLRGRRPRPPLRLCGDRQAGPPRDEGRQLAPRGLAGVPAEALP